MTRTDTHCFPKKPGSTSLSGRTLERNGQNLNSQATCTRTTVKRSPLKSSITTSTGHIAATSPTAKTSMQSLRKRSLSHGPMMRTTLTIRSVSRSQTLHRAFSNILSRNRATFVQSSRKSLTLLTMKRSRRSFCSTGSRQPDGTLSGVSTRNTS